MPPLKLSKVRVTYPGGQLQSARFLYHNNRAAVWVEDRATKTATRVLYSTDVTVYRPRRGTAPITVTTSEGDVWEIMQTGGRRGACGSCNSVFKRIPLSTLLDPEVATL